MFDSVRAVLFDAVGTLIHTAPPVGQVYFEAGKRHGSQLTEHEILRRFREAFQQSAAMAVTNEERELHRWRKIVAGVFEDVPQEADSLFEELWQHFAEPQHWDVYSDIEPVLELLVARNVTIGIASNFDQRLKGIAAAKSALAPLLHLFISSEIGFAKPHQEFFRAVERRFNLAPDELLLVGDDFENDFQAAQASGWKALWLQRERNESSDLIIRSLIEVGERL